MNTIGPLTSGTGLESIEHEFISDDAMKFRKIKVSTLDGATESIRIKFEEVDTKTNTTREEEFDLSLYEIERLKKMIDYIEGVQ